MRQCNRCGKTVADYSGYCRKCRPQSTTGYTFTRPKSQGYDVPVGFPAYTETAPEAPEPTRSDDHHHHRHDDHVHHCSDTHSSPSYEPSSSYDCSYSYSSSNDSSSSYSDSGSSYSSCDSGSSW